MAPFWIHCNLCSIQFSKDMRMFMLNCKHLLCKNCMNKTERGTKCPLCKKNIKFEDLMKLNENTKAYFNPNVVNSLSNDVKKLEFQSDQQMNLCKMSREYKAKFFKASQMKANLEQEVLKLKAEAEKLSNHRKLMRAKLKEIYLRNLSVPYRNTSSLSIPSIASARHSTPNSSFSRPTFMNSTLDRSNQGSGFFNNNAPMMMQGQGDNSFISGISAISQSHSNRQPFFA